MTVYAYKCASLKIFLQRHWIVINSLVRFSVSFGIELLPLGGSNAIRQNKGAFYGQQAAIDGHRCSDAHFTAACLDVVGCTLVNSCQTDTEHRSRLAHCTFECNQINRPSFINLGENYFECQFIQRCYCGIIDRSLYSPIRCKQQLCRYWIWHTVVVSSEPGPYDKYDRATFTPAIMGSTSLSWFVK